MLLGSCLERDFFLQASSETRSMLLYVPNHDITSCLDLPSEYRELASSPKFDYVPNSAKFTKFISVHDSCKFEGVIALLRGYKTGSRFLLGIYAQGSNFLWPQDRYL